MHIESLHIHPVKSTAPLDLSTATVEPWGLAGDRRWLVAEAASGKQVTAREHQRLFMVTAHPGAPGELTLSRPGVPELRISLSPDARRPISVWDNPMLGTDAGDEAAQWFGALLERDVRLVWLDDPTQRPTNPRNTKATDRVSLADGYPLMVTNTASLAQLNEWVAKGAADRGEPAPEPLVMQRFRPSAVIAGSQPFAEEQWRKVRIGAVPFRMVKLCDRCVMTTVHPETLQRGKEPIRTLARYKSWAGKTWFGANLVPDGAGDIHVGDEVEVLEKAH